ncbi:hypothetical protein LJR239_000889 [Neorhizobium tomejilense]
MMSLFRRTLLAAALLPTIAQAADCPSSKTAKNGFVLGRLDALSEFRKAKGPLVQIITSFGGPDKQIVYSFEGLFDLSREDRKEKYARYPLSDLSNILPLKKGDRHAINFVPFDAKRSADDWVLELTVTAEETVSVGRCKYDVFRVKQETKQNGKTTENLSFLYSPDLHVTLAKIYDEGTGNQAIVGYEHIRPLAR